MPYTPAVSGTPGTRGEAPRRHPAGQLPRAVSAGLPTPWNRTRYRFCVTTSFPDDLTATQRELHAVRHERSALLAQLPTFAAASAAPGAAEWMPGDPPLGRTAQQAEREAELRERERQLAQRVHGHAFWSTLEGPELVAARSELKTSTRT